LRTDIDLVHRRSVERDMRLGTSLTELARDVRDLTHVVHDWRDEHRLDRADLHDRVVRLERHAGFKPQ
jgi:DNA-binding HxlR family transcriptional regulator